MGFFNGMDDLWGIEGPRSPRLGMARMPKKTGGCSITGCRRTPTEWHHIIARGRIRRRRLDPALLTDPGNLVELCGHHHAMTMTSLVKGFKEREEAGEGRTGLSTEGEEGQAQEEGQAHPMRGDHRGRGVRGQPMQVQRRP